MAQTTNTKQTDHEQTKTATLLVGGMTCASCVRRIERGLEQIDGVDYAEVNLATDRATVIYDPAKVSIPDLVAKIEATGYTAQAEKAVEAPQAGQAEADLAVVGMTCASC